MPACKLPDYVDRFPIGTQVIYLAGGGRKPLRARIAETPVLFRTNLTTCVVTLDNGALVPCADLILPDEADPACILPERRATRLADGDA